VEFALYGKKLEDLPEAVSFESGTELVWIVSGPPLVEMQPDGVVAKKYKLSVKLLPPSLPGFAHTPLYARFQDRGGLQGFTPASPGMFARSIRCRPGKRILEKWLPRTHPSSAESLSDAAMASHCASGR
jgi:hypothetical protein